MDSDARARDWRRAIGMLATYQLRQHGLAVWTAARSSPKSEKGRLVAESGAQYVSTAATPLAELREAVGGFDLVVEASGNARLMLSLLGLLRRNGVGCLLGLDSYSRPITIESGVIGIDAVLENRVLVGSVNAHRSDWHGAVEQLDATHEAERRLDRLERVRPARPDGRAGAW